ncbi:hypothetical protein M406DRAFT_71504 [Cryphonectria parasitica EP155]|uniref:non-specific serine/threonine protein kinase n=1 Tax=Cryphonectria parasitica (strain ATCC 38755 / EP155) TaxID=660469 RepID=A0A9P4Y8X7_CRYP1|nr:uncharacterized protein M406DRAFT_71504 [Cryphonectria parasitica EP155]KAF3768507.1 hypothetical protein M406DRAFT_71504 [Cryphonectria parasitica EP155]
MIRRCVLLSRIPGSNVEREEEGELLRKAMDRDVINVARYYHHETVQVGGRDDDIQSNVRKELDIARAKNCPSKHSISSQNTSAATTPRIGRTAGLKRSSSQAGVSLPPSKRSCSVSSTKAESQPVSNRVHRRVVVRDFGEPIYKASSPAALLRALEGCIRGHESLYRKAGLLHRDISINNLIINEDRNNPSWPAFLIDLDLAIAKEQQYASEAKRKTGTRAFMAIGVLVGEQHSFMHDLESFFWVLFWICIHYAGPDDRGRIIPQFDQWNFIDTVELAQLKLGTVSDDEIFRRTVTGYFTEYYEPVIPWINKLRRIVFPGGGRWKSEDEGLYSSMKKVLDEAANELK